MGYFRASLRDDARRAIFEGRKKGTGVFSGARAIFGRPYGTHIEVFRRLNFVDATAAVTLAEREVVVRFQKRAHNPLLVVGGFDHAAERVPGSAGSV